METKPTIETVLERLSAMESRITNRLDALETQVSEFRARLDTLETQVSGFGARLETLETQVTEGFQKVNKTLEHMKHKVEIMTQDIMDMRASLRALDQRIPRAIEPSVA